MSGADPMEDALKPPCRMLVNPLVDSLRSSKEPPQEFCSRSSSSDLSASREKRSVVFGARVWWVRGLSCASFAGVGCNFPAVTRSVDLRASKMLAAPLSWVRSFLIASDTLSRLWLNLRVGFFGTAHLRRRRCHKYDNMVDNDIPRVPPTARRPAMFARRPILFHLRSAIQELSALIHEDVEESCSLWMQDSA